MHRSVRFVAIFIGGLALAGCETLPPNPLSPQLYEQLHVESVQVEIADGAPVVWSGKVMEYQRENGLKRPELTVSSGKERFEQLKARKEYNERIKKEAPPYVRKALIAGVTDAITEEFADEPAGQIPARIDVLISGFRVPGGGQTILIGGNESLAGEAKIIRLDDSAELAAYNIVITADAGGGVFAAMLNSTMDGDAAKRLGEGYAERLKLLMKRVNKE